MLTKPIHCDAPVLVDAHHSAGVVALPRNPLSGLLLNILPLSLLRLRAH